MKKHHAQKQGYYQCKLHW